jgi:hypothetical protein
MRLDAVLEAEAEQEEEGGPEEEALESPESGAADVEDAGDAR